MRMNIDIDDTLMAEVMKVPKAKTKKEAVIISMENEPRGNKQLGIIKLMGKIDGDWNIDARRRD
jgi:Bacterial antitoxin of type II TA system, VapB